MADILIYAIYNTTSGEITKVFGVGIDDILTIPGNTGVGEASSLETSVNATTQYYVSSVITTRPLFTSVGSWDTTTITANGISSATFGSSLPNPTTAVITTPPDAGTFNTVSATITTGSFTITTPVAGTYQVTLTAFPYQQLTTTITAT